MESRGNLVDISTIVVDCSLSKPERVQEFARQIKYPDHFLCCGYEVTAGFSTSKLSFAKCLLGGLQ